MSGKFWLVAIIPLFYLFLVGCSEKSKFAAYDVRFQGKTVKIRLKIERGQGVSLSKIAEEIKIEDGATIAIIPLKYLIDGNPSTADGTTITIPRSDWETNTILSGAVVHFLPN